jgi:transposase-like protein
MNIAIKDNVPTPARPSGVPQARSEHSNGIPETLAMFADELSAHRYLEGLLWPNGVCCPRCGSDKIGKLNGESTRLGIHKCYGCRKIFSILHGTLMSGSHVPPHKWLQAIYLTEGGTKPMRPHQLGRILDVSFNTARSMMRRIGEAADSLHPVPSTRSPSREPLPFPGTARAFHA